MSLHELSRTRTYRMVRLAMLRRSFLVLVLLATACTTGHWGWRPLDQATPLKSYEVARISSRGVMNEWHAVVITQDSVSGIPSAMSVSCDSCRRSLPRSQIDSMALGYRQHNVAKEGLVVLGFATLALVVEAGVCALIHAGNDC